MVTPAEDTRARTSRRIAAALLGAMLLFTGIFGTAASAAATPAENQTLEPVEEEVTPEPVETEVIAEESTPEPEATPNAEAQETPTPQAFSATATGEAIIQVQVGGDRTSASNVAGLAGVELRLNKGDAAGPENNPVDAHWATCISDAQGICEFTVAESDFDSFWVVQAAAPEGWYANESLTVSGNSSGEYQFHVGNQLQAGKTYELGKNFTGDVQNGNNRHAISGIWQNSRDNPQLGTCEPGMNIALVLDQSKEMNEGKVKNAAHQFVESMNGTGSSIAIHAFSNPGNSGQKLSSTTIDAANKQKIGGAIDSYKTRGNHSNWDLGLWQVAAAEEKYDLTIVITGKNPTDHGHGKGSSGSGNFTQMVALEEAIFSANALKATGSRVVAISAGSDSENLRAISGPTEYSADSSAATAAADYARLEWGELENFMTSLAKELNCEPTLEPDITIEKLGWDTPTADELEGATQLVSEETKVPRGQKITWTYEVENTGETILHNIEVVDDAPGSNEVVCPAETLEVGESMTCTASGAVTPNL
ncbi:vWA domain-containing protein [Yaniella halotolerans]|uniref:vWA domain-containing protein n=1 Tax=Yaniella halotolerans TaxID=225453 RepID=UPI0003B44360|nr:vWA domain-containing protein [Yaniella halotolerans]